MRYLMIAALLALAGCAHGSSGNSHIDYTADTFSTVNHCMHTTMLRCR